MKLVIFESIRCKLLRDHYQSQQGHDLIRLSVYEARYKIHAFFNLCERIIENCANLKRTKIV